MHIDQIEVGDKVGYSPREYYRSLGGNVRTKPLWEEGVVTKKTSSTVHVEFINGKIRKFSKWCHEIGGGGNGWSSSGPCLEPAESVHDHNMMVKLHNRKVELILQIEKKFAEVTKFVTVNNTTDTTVRGLHRIMSQIESFDTTEEKEDE